MKRTQFKKTKSNWLYRYLSFKHRASEEEGNADSSLPYLTHYAWPDHTSNIRP